MFYSYGRRLGTKTIASCSKIISGLDLCNPKFLAPNPPVLDPNPLSNYLAPNEGIAIQCKNGEMFIECNLPVYIQSPFLNYMNRADARNVEKLEPSNGNFTHRVKIFDENAFKHLMRWQFAKGYDAVHELVKFSKSTLSFFSGWNQHEILQKRCWLEITVDNALYTLDNLLSYLGSSDQQVTSVS